MTDQHKKCEVFAELHNAAEAFIIPNPWDPGSARLLQGLGFTALATTSAGFAYAHALSDGQPTLEAKLAHCEALAVATDIPINADFEDGYADGPDQVAINLLQLVQTGVAGCSIEDFSRTGQRLYDFNEAVERVAAAAEAVRTLKMPFQLTARAENLLRGVTDMDDTIKRLQAFQAAGADVLYAPGIRSLDDLKTVTAALERPFNVLASFLPEASLADFSAAGAARVSLGAALTWASVKPLLDASREMLEAGTFSWLGNIATGAQVNALLQD